MNGNEVQAYVLSPEELKELWEKFGKPGEVAPGVKATKKRNKLIDNRAASSEEQLA